MNEKEISLSWELKVLNIKMQLQYLLFYYFIFLKLPECSNKRSLWSSDVSFEISPILEVSRLASTYAYGNMQKKRQKTFFAQGGGQLE